MSGSAYDSFAWFYHHHWSDHFHLCAVSIFEKLAGSLPEGSRVLDLCCGAGKLAHELTNRGLRITGVDASMEMLRYARAASPESAFVCVDARRFGFRPGFRAAASMFDSMNHILSAEDLLAVFRNVHACLQGEGIFVFDALLESSYINDWSRSCTTVDDEHACFIRGGYDPARRLGTTEVTLFRKQDQWRRTDITFNERFYPPEELAGLLRNAGFSRIECLDAASDLKIEGTFSSGRVVFLARRGDTE